MGTVAWWFIPWLGGTLWIAGGTLRLLGGPARTQAQWALALFSIASGGFCVSEGLYFLAPTAGDSTLWVKLGLSFLLFSTPSFLLFGRWLHGRRSPRDLYMVLPVPALIALVWLIMVRSTADETWGFSPVYDPFALVAVHVYVAVCVLGALPWLRIDARGGPGGSNTALQGRVFMASVVGVLLGATPYALTNTIADLHWPPITGSLLALPALLSLLFHGRLGEATLTRLILPNSEGPPGVLEAYLVNGSGQILASRAKSPSGQGSDSSIPMVLETISQVVGTAFPGAKGEWVRTIHHGDIRVLVERGPRLTLALVVRGKVNPAIREEMRFVLQRIEGSSGTDPVEGEVEQALAPLFQRPEVF